MSADKAARLTSPDWVAVWWHLDDVKMRAVEQDLTITDEQAREVLALLTSKHDATIGVNWEVIDVWIDYVLQDAK